MPRFYRLLYESITDVTKRVDGKLLTIAAVATCVVLSFPIGWIFKVWPPDYVWISTLGFLAAALGIDAALTSKALEAARPRAAAAPVNEIENADQVTIQQ